MECLTAVTYMFFLLFIKKRITSFWQRMYNKLVLNEVILHTSIYIMVL